MNQVLQVNYFQIIRRRWVFITVVTLLVVLLSLVFSLLQPFRYESKVTILIIQKSAVGLDAYSASKSAERIGRNLAQIVYSSSFFNKVMNYNSQIDKAYFPTDEEKRREEWSAMVAAQVPSGSTLLNVSVYHPERAQATVIAQAITQVLLRDATEYVGVSDVELKVVDEPLTSNYPVKPNVVLNLILGFVAGFFLAIAIVLVSYSGRSPDERHLKKTQKKLAERNLFHEPMKSQAKVAPEAPASRPAIPKINFDAASEASAMTPPSFPSAASATPPPAMPHFSDEDSILTMPESK